MSYCRYNGDDSTVYMIKTSDNYHCFCKLVFHNTPSLKIMFFHLILHVLLGDKVPLRTFKRILRELKEQKESK